jgi:DNA-binding transcriptional ArsR family regulator
MTGRYGANASVGAEACRTYGGGMDADIASVAAVIADPTRAAMLDALLGDEALTAGELARAADVAPSTASEHLRRLTEAGLVYSTPAGRHRYHRLTGPDVAEAMEALALIAPQRERRPSTLRRVRADAAMTYARTCYDHLAGVVGVTLVEGLVSRDRLRWDDGLLRPGPGGTAWLDDLGIDVDRLRARRGPLVRTCIDWTSRRPHLAGAVGAAIADHALSRKWVVRRAHGHRALRVTAEGREAFRTVLGCDLPPPPKY